MELNNEKRKEIVSQIKEYADYFGENYNDDGINFIIDSWVKNKGWLIDKLRELPEWDEEQLRVAINVKVGGEIDKDNINLLYWDLLDRVTLAEKERKIFQWLMYTGVEEEKSYDFKPYISKRCIEKIRELGDEFNEVRFVENEKTMSVIIKFAKFFNLVDRFDKYTDKNGKEKSSYYKWEAKIGDAINAKAKDVQVYLSANPIDYCSMSLGVSWQSCYRWGEGEYRSGTLAYLCDNNTLIAYTTNDEKLAGAYKKIHRQCWFIDDRGNAIQSRLYPQSFDTSMTLFIEWGDAISDVIKNLFGVEYKFKEIKSKRSIDVGSNCVGYCDLAYGGNSIGYYIDDKIGNFRIAKKQYFLDCDYCQRRDDNTLSIYIRQCCNCGEEDCELHYIDGEYYCENCCFYCEYHEEWEVGEGTYVEDYGRVCDDALNGVDFYKCSFCNEWHHRDDNTIDIEDETYCCEDCAKEAGYEEIDGEWYDSDDIYTCVGCGIRYYADNEGEEIVAEDGETFCCQDCAKDAGYYENDDGEWVKKEEQEEKKEEEQEEKQGNKESISSYNKDLEEAFRIIAEPVGV